MNKNDEMIDEANEIINSYISHVLGEDVKILGREHPYEVCGCSIGEIEEAYNLLQEHKIF